MEERRAREYRTRKESRALRSPIAHRFQDLAGIDRPQCPRNAITILTQIPQIPMQSQHKSTEPENDRKQPITTSLNYNVCNPKSRCNSHAILKSPCNRRTDGPEYIEPGGSHGPSVLPLQQDSRFKELEG